MRLRFIIVATASLCLLLSQWAEAEVYNDGGVYTILDGFHEWVTVDDPPPILPAFTTVSFGGTATTNGLWAYNNSQVTIDGGAVIGLGTFGSGQVTMNDGSLLWLTASDNSQVTINGGSIYGGPVSFGMFVEDNAQLTIVGSDFFVYEDYTHTVLSFSGYGDLTGGSGGWIWGTLASGDLLEGVPASTWENGQVSLVPVPLPGAALLGAIGLGLAGWLRRSTR